MVVLILPPEDPSPQPPRSLWRQQRHNPQQLELRHVEFLRRDITVAHQLKKMTGREAYLGPTKTKSSMRTVELPTVTSNALALHLKQYPTAAREIDDDTNPKTASRREASLVFTTSSGLPVTRSSWPPVWRRAIKRTKLPPEFTLHSLRHYFATLLIHNGGKREDGSACSWT